MRDLWRKGLISVKAATGRKKSRLRHFKDSRSYKTSFERNCSPTVSDRIEFWHFLLIPPWHAEADLAWKVPSGRGTGVEQMQPKLILDMPQSRPVSATGTTVPGTNGSLGESH